MQHSPWSFAWKYWSGLAILLCLFRLFLARTEELVPVNNVWQKSRIRLAMAAIASGAMAVEKDRGIVLMLGASEPALGFQPEEFDRHNESHGLATRSFNLSAYNVGAVMPLYLARIRSELQKKAIRARLIFVGLPLPRFTVQARSSFYARSKYHDVDSVLFEPGLWAELNLPMKDKLILLFNKWMLGERSVVQLQRAASQLTRRFLGSILGHRGRPLMAYEKRLHPEPAWSPQRRGGFYLNIENEAALVAQLINQARHPTSVRADLADLISCCDLIEMNFDEAYLREVAAAIGRLHEVTDRVVLVLFPERPGLTRAEGPLLRIDRALKLISEESGAGLIENGDMERFGENDFIDQSHFSPSGVEKFNRILSDLFHSGLR